MKSIIKPKEIIKSEKAVSEVIGMALVLSMMMIAIGTIMLFGVPMIESGKFRAKMDISANSFLTLQNDIEEVVRGPIWVRDPRDTTTEGKNLLLGPSRETEFELMGGTLTVLPNSTNVYCIPVSCSTINANNFTIIIPAGNIRYTADNEEIAYESGAVMRRYEAGVPLMVSDPLISIYDNGSGGTVVSIHAISINGTLSSVGGDGKAWAEARLMNYSQIVESPASPNLNKTKITIYSNHPEAWKAFFDKKLQEAELKPSPEGNRTGYYIYTSNAERRMQVQIYGKANNDLTKDIFLAVYESKLDVRAR